MGYSHKELKGMTQTDSSQAMHAPRMHRYPVQRLHGLLPFVSAPQKLVFRELSPDNFNLLKLH